MLTTYPEISKGRFREMGIIIPQKPIAIEFERLTGDIIRRVQCLKRFTKQLEAARDILLPRLMNGS
jgi:restriction endonuclease S subunit